MDRRLMVAAGVGFFAAVAGFSVNQLELADWSWWWVVAAVVCGAAAAFGAATIGGLGRIVSWESSDKRGRPPVLAAVGDSVLGVHPSRFPGVRITRDADRAMAEAVDEGAKWVIAAGPRFAGTSTVAALAIRRRWPSRRVLVVTSPSADQVRASFSDAVMWSRKGYGAVLWLENTSRDALNAVAAVLDSYADFQALRLMVVMTTHEIDISPYPKAALVAVGPLNEPEREAIRATPALAEVLPAMDAGDYLIGHLLGSTLRIRNVLAGEAARVSVLRCLIDWHQAELHTPLSRQDLTLVASGYAKASGFVVDARALRKAVRSLRREGPGDGNPWVDGRSARALHPHAVLPAYSHPADSPTEPPLGWPIPLTLWHHIATATENAERHRVGLRLLRTHKALPAHIVLDGLGEIDTRDWMELGTLLQEHGHPREARAAFKSATASDGPDAARAWALLGDLELDEGEFDAARVAYITALGPNHPDVAPQGWISLGILEEAVGNPDAARTAYRAAIATKHPALTPRAWICLGTMEEAAGDFGAARAAYQAAIRINHPDISPRAKVSLGNLEVAAGDFEAALDAYELAVSTNHPDAVPFAWIGAGNVASKFGDLVAARASYGAAIAAGHPDATPKAWFNLGEMEGEAALTQAARAAYQAAIDSGHPDVAPKAWFNLGILEEAAGQVDAARSAYRAAANHPDKAPFAWVNLGSLEFDSGQIAAARTAFRAAIATGHPDASPQAWFNLGVLEREEMQVGAARTAYQATVDTGDPDLAAKALINLGNLEDRVGRTGAARDAYRRAIRTAHPDVTPKAWVNLGILQRTAGEHDEARASFQAAIDTAHPESSRIAKGQIRELDLEIETHRRVQNRTMRGY